MSKRKFKSLLVLALLLVVSFNLTAAPISRAQGPGGEKQPDKKSFKAFSPEAQTTTSFQASGLNQSSPYAESMPESGPITAIIVLEGQPAAAVSATENGTPSQAAFSAAMSQTASLEAAQRSLSALLASSMNIQTIGHLVYLTNGLVVNMDASQIKEVQKLPGVKMVVPDQSLELDTSRSVPFIGAPSAWGLGPGYTGTGMRIGIIDSGIDYTHRNFGGSGSVVTYNTQDATDISDIGYDGSKVVGGYDFVGNTWTSSQPLPAVIGTGIPLVPGGWAGVPYTVGENDPIDCINNGHGSHVAGISAGYGVDSAGNTYTGAYPPASFSTMIIGPGVAPEAELYALKIGACTTSVSFAAAMLAVDFAMDPNGDGNMSDHLDVTNSSYGGAYGAPAAEVLDQAFDLASANGVVMVASAGNDGDTYFVHGDPAMTASAISVASSVSDTLYKGLRIDSGPAGAYASYPVVIPANGSAGGALGTFGSYPLRLVGGAGNAQGCNVANYAGFAGEVGLIIWTSAPSGCGSGARMNNAVNAGGVSGLVVVSANPTDFPFINLACTYGGGYSPIPCVSITATDGTILQTNPGGFNVTFDSSLTAALGVSMADKLSGFSSHGPSNGEGTTIPLKPDVAAPGDMIYSTGVGTGNQNRGLGGTSMASPHVTGMVALLRQLHPTWSVAQIKALVMNTATHDLWTGTNQTGDNYSLSRVGAGRVDIANAVGVNVVAYSANEPERVSVSFGLVEVINTVTLAKTITVQNLGATSQRYNVQFQPIRTMTGVNYTVSPASIQIPGGSTRTVTVTLTANKANMVEPHLPDPTISETQSGAFGSLPRLWISEADGYVVLDATSASPDLRVPVYAVVRPAANMAADGPLMVGPSNTGSAPLYLAGEDINTGNNIPYDVKSQVSAFELVYENTTGPTNGDFTDNAMVHYVGVTSDYPAQLVAAGGNVAAAIGNTTVYFALVTYGNWNSAVAFDTALEVGVDSNEDTLYDATVFNWETGYLAGADWTDTILSYVTDGDSWLVGPGNVVGADFVNGLPASVLDTNVMNNHVMVLPVSAAALGLTGANTDFQFDVHTLKYFYWAEWTAMFTYDVAHPVYSFTDTSGLAGGPYPGIPLWNDYDGNFIPVDYDLSAYLPSPALDGSQPLKAPVTLPSILLLHHHNAGADNRAELVQVELSNNVEIDLDKTVSDREPARGDTIAYTITATNNGPAEASDLVLEDILPAGLTFVSSTCPGITTTAPSSGGGTRVVCDLTGFALPNGASLSYNIVVTVDVAVDGQYTNTVVLTKWSPLINIFRPVGQAGPDKASVDICVGSNCTPVDNGQGGGAANINVFDPSVSKLGKLEAGALGLPGEQLTWILTISNTGGAAGTNVTVVDNVRPELRVDSADIDKGAVTVAGQTVTFLIPVLNPGETIQARVHTTVLQGPYSGQFENSATISGTGPNGVVTDSGSAVVSAASSLPSTGYPPAPESSSKHGFNPFWLIMAGGLVMMGGLVGIAVKRTRRRI